MLIPMALANRQKAFWFAFLCTLGATIGAGFGYAIGYFFFDIAGEHIIMLYNKGDTFKNIQEEFNEFAWLVILVAAITPIPFKIATITAGFVQTNFLIFILAAILGRSIRYGSVSLLIVLFGEQIEQFLENHFNLALTIGGVIFVAGWFLII
ncbi:MAG: DedA family protein [Alphaproteobacteria bacterium]|nr:DedA family protein [Alphaproteobacteria bacterium]